MCYADFANQGILLTSLSSGRNEEEALQRAAAKFNVAADQIILTQGMNCLLNS